MKERHEDKQHSGERDAGSASGRTAHPGGSHILFLTLTGLVFVGFTVIFLFFERPVYSELEKRDLATFPTADSIKKDPAKLPASISQWFSDSEPYRDVFMKMSMTLRDKIKYIPGDGSEAISIKPVTTEATADATPEEEALVDQGNPLAEANAKIANSGIIIVGSGPEVRALMAYGGTGPMTEGYIRTVDAYADAFPSATVYALPIPNSTEFYIPDKVAKRSKSQKATVEYVRDHLGSKAKYVDAYSQLSAHTTEPIYLRTDHHWAPLGAHYAAKALAKTAGVPFRELDSYEEHVIHNYVGTMYGYSKDISVKNAPEDFVYYKPKGLTPETTYITYKLNKNYQIVNESGPYKEDFFHDYPDGATAAYCTFMGGDHHIVKVKTGTPSERRMLIIKDSFGNAIPSNLFYSFGEVHVADFRYFPKNMKKYVDDNKITDIVLAFNVFNICSSKSMERVRNFLTQSEN